MRQAHFSVDTRLTRLLGETYRSSEAALKELVDNAWDADASCVRIRLPKPLSGDPVVISDDGLGMTEGQMRAEYLNIARDKRETSGDLTLQLKRRIKGRKGIGKFAGLSLARVMEVESVAGDQRSKLILDKDELGSTPDDLEAVPLSLSGSDAEGAPSGTTVTLRDLDQRLNFPTPERLRELLVYEYGRSADFKVEVDETQLSVEDIPGPTTAATTDLSEGGRSALQFTIAEGRKPLRSPGIILKVNGKVVGRPRFFGLDEDDEVPSKLLRRVYGEVELTGSEDFVTSDWGDVVENSRAYASLQEVVGAQVKQALREARGREMGLQKARLQQQIAARLGKLPEHRRKYAEQAVLRLLSRFYGESNERISAVADVALDAMEHEDYWVVIEHISSTGKGDVGKLAEALAEFGLVDLAHIGAQARGRLGFLDGLDALLSEEQTLEKEMHTALEGNLWVLGRGYATMASNRTLRALVADRFGGRFEGEFANRRPDLLLSQDYRDRFLLIEFKRPADLIKRSHIAQAETYRDELRPYLRSGAEIDVLLIGRGKVVNVSDADLARGVEVLSYHALVSAARAEIEWLTTNLAA